MRSAPTAQLRCSVGDYQPARQLRLPVWRHAAFKHASLLQITATVRLAACCRFRPLELWSSTPCRLPTTSATERAAASRTRSSNCRSALAIAPFLEIAARPSCCAMRTISSRSSASTSPDTVRGKSRTSFQPGAFFFRPAIQASAAVFHQAPCAWYCAHSES